MWKKKLGTKEDSEKKGREAGSRRGHRADWRLDVRPAWKPNALQTIFFN